MKRIISAVVVAAFFASCAPKTAVRWEPGAALAHDKTNSVPRTPVRAVRAETRVRLRANDRTMHFEAVVVADSSRGRMEALGPFGVALATVVWRDSTWSVWLPSQGALVRGTGDSLSLPVVGMRTIRPRELVAPLLGNAFSAPAGTPLRKVGGDDHQVVLMPLGSDPRWAMTLDRASGVPLRRQILRNGKESERLSFGAWKLRDGVPVPDSIVRTGRDSQRVSLRLVEWSRLDSLDARLLDLTLEKPVDTIIVVRDGAGRQRYRIRPAGGGAPGTTETVVDSLPGGDEDESIDDPSDDDPSATQDDDSGNASEEDDLPEE